MQTLTLSSNVLSFDGENGIGNLSASNNPSLLQINANGLVHAGALQIANNAALQSVNLPALRAYSGGTSWNLFIQSNAVLTSLSAPLLVTSTGLVQVGDNPLLSVLQLDSLAFCVSGFVGSNNPSLVTLNLPALVVSQVWGLRMNGCSALANVSLAKYLPSNGRQQNFSGCALTEASVDHILARCVANPAYLSGTVDLSGGTSAPPSVAGAADKATLIARGCTVLTN